MAEKYGFVYLWYDRKHKRFYIGSHWGTEDDGYICSSNWMRDAYRRRPQDFRRRIIQRIFTTKSDLLMCEDTWLRKISFTELGKRYYNLRNTSIICNRDQVNKKFSKLRWCNNGKTNKRVVDIPIGWKEGRINYQRSRGEYNLPYYNNGIKTIRCKEGEQPLGWKKGRLTTWSPDFCSGSRWITDGKIEFFSPKDKELPEGWYYGRRKRIATLD